MEASLTIEGLTYLDGEAVKKKLLPGDDVETQEMIVADGAHGEPATIALTLILSHVAIAALTVLFGKAGRRRIHKTRWRLRKPDGTEIEFDQIVRNEQTGALDPKLVAELKDLGFDAALLSDTLKKA